MASQAVGTSLDVELAIGLKASSRLDRDAMSARDDDDPRPEIHARLIDVLLDDFSRRMAIGIDIAVTEARLALSPDDDPDLIPAALGFAPGEAAMHIEMHRGLVRRLLEEVGFDADGATYEADAPPWFSVRWEGGSVEISIEGAAFRSGSLLGWLKVKVRSGVVLATLLAAGATPPAVLWYDDLVQTQRIEFVYRDTPCRVEFDFSIDRDALRRLAVDQLDFNAAGIDAWEQRLRICRVQFALRILGHAPGPLDGVAGSNTHDAWRRYAAAKNFEGKRFGDRIVLDSLAFDAAQVRLN